VVGLDVAGWPCVVVGAGTVGTRRARTLAGAGAEVTVVAPMASDEVRSLAAAGRLRWEARRLEVEDLAGARLVVAAADDAATNTLAAEGAPSEALVSRADRAAAGHLTFPPLVRRGPVAVAVASGGRAPAVSAWVADRLDAAIDGAIGLDADGLALLVDLVAEVRSDGTAVTPGPGDWRSALARTMLDDVLLDLIRAGRRDQAKDRLLACLSSS
jgi:siroheme synthase-like protein